MAPKSGKDGKGRSDKGVKIEWRWLPKAGLFQDLSISGRWGLEQYRQTSIELLLTRVVL
jgi:hypothetical protein